MQEASLYERQLAEEENQKSFEELKASGKMEIYTLTEEDREKFVAAVKRSMTNIPTRLVRNTSKQLKVAINSTFQGTFSRMCRNVPFLLGPDLSVD